MQLNKFLVSFRYVIICAILVLISAVSVYACDPSSSNTISADDSYVYATTTISDPWNNNEVEADVFLTSPIGRESDVYGVVQWSAESTSTQLAIGTDYGGYTNHGEVYASTLGWSFPAPAQVTVFPPPPPPPQVTMTNADIVADQIAVTLSPNGQSGTLIVSVGSTQVFNGQKSSGSYTFPFNRESLPLGQYSSVTAQWTTAGGTAQDQRSVSFNVMGHDWRQSRYNTPYEGNCTGGTDIGYLVEYSQQQCTYTSTMLNTNFMNLVGSHISGTGYGTSVGISGLLASEFKYGQCLRDGVTPGERDFRPDTFNTACQGTASNYASDSTVAAPFNLIHSPSPRAGCGNQYLIVNPTWGTAVKNVTDYCPACGNFSNGHQFDNYTTNQACTSALGLVDNTTVIRLN